MSRRENWKFFKSMKMHGGVGRILFHYSSEKTKITNPIFKILILISSVDKETADKENAN